MISMHFAVFWFLLCLGFFFLFPEAEETLLIDIATNCESSFHRNGVRNSLIWGLTCCLSHLTHCPLLLSLFCLLERWPGLEYSAIVLLLWYFRENQKYRIKFSKDGVKAGSSCPAWLRRYLCLLSARERIKGGCQYFSEKGIPERSP